MSIRNLNWYNLQATRRYPLDDSCSGETDNGESLPNDIIVDCHIRFSNALGNYAYLQAVTVSEHLVTAVIGVSDDSETAGKTIAAVSIPKPAAINVNYLLTGLTDGVVGWIVFGAGINSPAFSGRFSTPRQTLLSARCARSYAPLPITSLNKLDVVPELQGIVNIEAQSPLRINYKKEEIGGEQKQLVVFSLDTTDASINYNPLSFFLGSCAERPESGTCAKPPIATINGVSPDCYGDIKINFVNLVGEKFAECGGIDVITDYGLQKACEGAPKLPLFYSDLCCPMRFDSIADRNQAPANEFSVGDIVRVGVSGGASFTPYTYYRVESVSGGLITWSAALSENDPDLKLALSHCDWPDPTEVIPDVIINLTALQDYPLVDLPACIDFCSCSDEPPMFNVVQGVFTTKRVMAPFGCIPCGESVQPAETQTDVLALRERNTYLSVDNGSTAISLFKNSASDWAFGRAISAQVRIEPNGLDRTGGVVVNYRKVVRNSVTQIRYFAAVIDVGRGQFRLLDYTNNSYIVVATVPFRVRTNQWYKVTVYPSLQGDYVYLNCVAEEMKNNGQRAEIVDYRVPLSSYEPQTGSFGLYAERSYTTFNAFTIT